MRIVAVRDHEALSRLTADLMVAELIQRRSPLFSCIPGRTPRRSYEIFRERVRTEKLPVEGLRHVQMNEWVGLGSHDDGSFAHDLEDLLLGPIGVTAERRIVFNGLATDLYGECHRVQQALTSHGPIDLMILGLGVNGHVAFNEPGGMLSPNAHLAELTAATRDAHRSPAREGEQPEDGMTLGFADIMAARRVMILVSGKHKAAQMARLQKQDVTTEFPASMLWMHPQAVCIADQDALGR